jgi:hypothetical protein
MSLSSTSQYSLKDSIDEINDTKESNLLLLHDIKERLKSIQTQQTDILCRLIDIESKLGD